MDRRISIVTICFNNLDELKLTMAHIDSQRSKPFEHIIIDGSTTPEIRNYLSGMEHPSYRHWLSEPDRGISDAFNKGILRATGDIIHLQNAGDYYYDDEVLQDVQEALRLHPGIAWLHGKYIQYRGGAWVVTGKAFDPRRLYQGMGTIGHPTMFVKREMYEKHGLFRLDKRIAMDYDFICRIAWEPFLYLDRVLVVFTPGGISHRQLAASLAEMQESYTRHFGASLANRLWIRRVELVHRLTETRLGKWLFQLKNRRRKL